jgi:hypothetical protein
MKYPTSIAKYRIEGHEYLAQYIGRQEGFECCVCGKGCNAFTFNIMHSDDIDNVDPYDYETWGYGPTHIDEAVELVEEYSHLVLKDNSVRTVVVKPVPITQAQKEAIERIQVDTAYEAMERIANILGIRTVQKSTWASSRKTLLVNEYTEASITFSRKTGKVKALSYTDHRDNEIRDIYKSIVFGQESR